MKTILNPFQSLYARQLIVAVAITGGAVAVAAAAVVFAERPLRDEIAPRPAAAETARGSDALDADRRPTTRSPKEAWRRLPPPWAPAAVPVPAPFDASLPAAADVLGSDAATADGPPTF